MIFVAVRVRGIVNVRGDITDTMKMLRLNKVNHCVLVRDSPSAKGMLRKCKDYITWGEIQSKTLAEIISKRGKLKGGVPISQEYLKENTEFKILEELAGAIIKGSTDFSKLPNIKPLFRLAPPVKGYEGIKRSYKEGGALGYRGKDINLLIRRMV